MANPYDVQIKHVEAFLAQPKRPWLVLLGPSGVGKSYVLRQFHEHVHAFTCFAHYRKHKGSSFSLSHTNNNNKRDVVAIDHVTGPEYRKLFRERRKTNLRMIVVVHELVQPTPKFKDVYEREFSAEHDVVSFPRTTVSEFDRLVSQFVSLPFVDLGTASFFAKLAFVSTHGHLEYFKKRCASLVSYVKRQSTAATATTSSSTKTNAITISPQLIKAFQQEQFEKTLPKEHVHALPPKSKYILSIVVQLILNREENQDKHKPIAVLHVDHQSIVADVFLERKCTPVLANSRSIDSELHDLKLQGFVDYRICTHNPASTLYTLLICPRLLLRSFSPSDYTLCALSESIIHSLI